MQHEPLQENDVALVVDLDGSLTPADVSIEALIKALKANIWAFFTIIGWFFEGKAGLKTRLARAVPFEPALLPLRPEVLDLIQAARDQGRCIILASASHGRYVRRVARHLGIFDTVIASDRRNNRNGHAKLEAINAELGGKPFDYIGDAAVDRPIWEAARTAYTVGVPTGCKNEVRLGNKGSNFFKALIKAMRPHQWAKNALVFVPVATAGLLGDIHSIAKAVMAFTFVSLLASSVYLLNDTLDIDADRAHKKKRHRPIASGDLPVPLALMASILLVFIGLAGAGAALGLESLIVLGIYLVITAAYSFRLKAAMIIDVIVLACLYTIRLQIGASAIDVAISFWLLLFSIFFFLSLAYLKRYIELQASSVPQEQLLNGRGYLKDDLDIVGISGISSGMVSLLVIILFANTMSESGDYSRPELLWLLVLPLLYWLNRIWMMAHRNQVDGDPIAFALRDRRSVVLAVIMAILMIGAKYL